MTETMMIIIVAGVVIMAFGLLCLIFISRSQKETAGFAKRMGAVEKDLGDISKLVSQNAADSQKADENIKQILKKQEEMCAEQEAERRAREEFQKAEAKPAPPAPQPPAPPQPQASPQPPAPLQPQAPPKPVAAPQPQVTRVIQKPVPMQEVERPAIVTPAIQEEPEISLDFDEIDINDLLDDLEDVLPELKSDFEPAVKTKQPEIIAPPVQHIDYDIGQSGKKYTASELDTLIRE